MSYLRYLCLLVHSSVQCILCCVVALFVSVLCLVYPMLPVLLDCPFLIAPLVFSNVYLVVFVVVFRVVFCRSLCLFYFHFIIILLSFFLDLRLLITSVVSFCHCFIFPS